MVIEHQRLIGEFLRAKRESISPDMVGLPAPLRTRTRGLRPEDVAELCGISTVWYSKIERGRAAGISAHVLLALNKALLLSESEYEYLCNLCSVQGHFHKQSCQTCAPETTQLLWQINPLPALFINDHLDMVAANKAFEMMAGFNLDSLSYRERNYLHLTLNNVDWQKLLCIKNDEQLNQQITRMAGFLRDSLAKRPFDGVLKQKIEEFRGCSSFFESAWVSNTVLGPEELLSTFHHAILGCITLNKKIWWSFSGDASSRVNIYHPQNEHDHQRLVELFQGSSIFLGR